MLWWLSHEFGVAMFSPAWMICMLICVPDFNHLPYFVESKYILNVKCKIAPEIVGFWILTNCQFNQLTAYLETKWFPKLSVSLNNSAKFDIIQLRPVLVPAFSQFSLNNFSELLTSSSGLTGSDPGFKARQIPSEWLHADLALFN